MTTIQATRRFISTKSISKNQRVLDWLNDAKSKPTLLTFKGHLSSTKALSLAKSLPPPFSDTRMLSQSPFFNLSKATVQLPPLWEIIYLNEAEFQSTEDIDQDGSDRMITQPPSLKEQDSPQWERMWVGGSFEYPSKTNGLMVNKLTRLDVSLDNVEFKVGKDGREGVYVTHQRTLRQIEEEEKDEEGVWKSKSPISIDRRTHLYRLPLTSPPPPSAKDNKSSSTPVKKTNPTPTFTIPCTPNQMHLFRFSALTFNGHRIHWDDEYSRTIEKKPGNLVHGPLTSLLLASAAAQSEPNKRLANWNYRATSPLVVGKPLTLNGFKKEDSEEIQMWASTEDGRVIMTGVAKLE